MTSKIVRAIGAALALGWLALSDTAYAQAPMLQAYTDAGCGNRSWQIGTITQPRFNPLEVLQTGPLCVYVVNSSSGGSSSVTQGTSPWVDNITQLGGNTIATGAGTSSAGTLRAILSSDSAVSVSNFPTSQSVTNGGTFAVQQTNATPTGTNSIGAVGLNAGTNAIGSITNTAFGISGSLPTGSNTIGAVTQVGGPWTVNLTQQAGTTLATPTTYGTAPSGNVPGVNAAVTNTVTTAPSTGATMTTSQPSVTTTAAALTFVGTVHREIANPAASGASIFIGASGVTTSTGWEIPAGASYDVSRFSGTLYAIAPSNVTARLISY